LEQERLKTKHGMTRTSKLLMKLPIKVILQLITSLSQLKRLIYTTMALSFRRDPSLKVMSVEAILSAQLSVLERLKTKHGTTRTSKPPVRPPTKVTPLLTTLSSQPLRLNFTTVDSSKEDHSHMATQFLNSTKQEE
jgi:hypothetical protein